MRFSQLSIRARITGGSLVIAVLISIAAGCVVYSEVRRIVSDGRASVLASTEAPYLTALRETPGEDIDDPGDGRLVAVVDPSGVARVDSLPAALDAERKGLVERSGETRTVVTNGDSYLVKVSSVTTDSGVWKVISAERDDVETSVLNQVAVLLIGSIAGINLAFGAASWFIGSAALRPVARLRRSAAELAARPGDDLLPLGSTHDEIAELADTLNGLISQLRASVQRERQIVSDASHEIRTPLAIMQTRLELALVEATSFDSLRADVVAVQQTLTRLTAIAVSLLELSRIDAQAARGSAAAAELAIELADAADRGRLRVGARGILLEYSSDVAAQRVAVSVADFGRVCDNLIGNSLAAMGSSGAIELVLTVGEATARLVVRDTAGGMAEQFLPFALDRFSRADHARSGGGAGLGLSIVTGIAETAGGSVSLENRPGDGLTVVVEFLIEGSASARP